MLDLDPDKPLPSTTAEDSRLPLKEDPKYAKFFKMLKMGLPRGAVVIKMTADGADPAVLDLDPDKPLPSKASRVGAVAGNELLGGGLFGGVRLPSPPTPGRLPRKPNDKPSVPLRSLFWTKIPDREIAGTIWAEAIV